MAKLVSHEDDVLTYEVLQLWTFRDHEVALIHLTNKAVPESAASYLMCECDFDLILTEDEGGSFRTHRNDPHACEAKKVVRNVAAMYARIVHGGAWKKMGLKESILDIKRRVEADEYLGQHVDRCVYTQEVARLLEREHDEVLAACGELYAEERLDLNGRILADYVPCFRFPIEMQAILRYVVEEPLGWPNGDAGDGWLAGFEREVQERHGFKSGKEAFGAHWPSIELLILAEYALEPVAAALLQSAATPMSGSKEERENRLGEALDWEGWGKALAGLARQHPDILPDAFREFMFGLMQLSFDRIEMDQAMRTVKIPPEETLREMAEYFTKLAAHFREQAVKD